MHAFLKERGLFAFLSEYLDRKQLAPNALLLAFGVRVVSAGRHEVRIRIGLGIDVGMPAAASDPKRPSWTNSECSKSPALACKVLSLFLAIT